MYEGDDQEARLDNGPHPKKKHLKTSYVQDLEMNRSFFTETFFLFQRKFKIDNPTQPNPPPLD